MSEKCTVIKMTLGKGLSRNCLSGKFTVGERNSGEYEGTFAFSKKMMKISWMYIFSCFIDILVIVMMDVFYFCRKAGIFEWLGIVFIRFEWHGKLF